MKTRFLRVLLVASGVMASGMTFGVCAADMNWGTGTWGQLWALDGVTAPPTISGTAFNPSDPGTSTSSSFAVGMTRNAGKSYVSTSSGNEQIEVVGFIHPEVQHIGKTADLFVVVLLNGTFIMQTQNGSFVPWNGNVTDLVPSKEDAVLTQTLQVNIFAGKVGGAATISIFLGYMTADGVLRYTPTASELRITE